MEIAPAPWMYEPRNDLHLAHEAYAVMDANGFMVANCTAKDVRAVTAAPDLLKACEHVLTWLTNVNTNDPATLARTVMDAMEKAGYDKAILDDAAVALVRGPFSCPNMMGED